MRRGCHDLPRPAHRCGRGGDAGIVAEIRRAGGSDAVRKAIASALARFPPADGAARSMGSDASTLRRAYERAGGTWPELARGRPRAVRLLTNPTDGALR